MADDSEFTTVLSGVESGTIEWKVQVRDNGPENFETFIRCESGDRKVMVGFGGPKLPEGESFSAWFGRTDFTPNITLVRVSEDVSAVLGEGANGQLYDIRLSAPSKWGLRFGVKFSKEAVHGLRVEVASGGHESSRSGFGGRPIISSSEDGGWTSK